jgi:phosphoribosyl-AMP cyclohydrolase
MKIVIREIQDVTVVMVGNLASPTMAVTMVTLHPTFQPHHHNNLMITAINPQIVHLDLLAVAVREMAIMAAVVVVEGLHLKHQLYLLSLNHLKDSLFLTNNNRWILLPTTITVAGTEDMKVRIEEATITVARVVVAMMATQAEEMMAMVVTEEEAMMMAVEGEAVVHKDKDKEIWAKDSSNSSSSKVRVNKVKDKDKANKVKVKVVQKEKEEEKGNLVDMRVREEGRMIDLFLLLRSPFCSS